MMSNATVVAALVIASISAGPAFAQSTYPNKPLRLIVGFAAGGAVDITARIVAKRLTELLGQPIVIDNRPGAGGVLAMDQQSKAAPDGYSFHLASSGPLVVNPHAQPNLPYDVRRDIAPLTMAVTFSNVLVTHAGVPVTTLAGFLDMARAKPGSVTYASSGMASLGHLAGELLRIRAKVELTHVAYRGGAPAMNDLLGGQVNSMMATLATSLPHIKSGKLRALAVTSLKRADTLPQVPTVAELGFPEFDATNWYAFVTSTKVPPEIRARLSTALQESLRARDVRDQLAVHGMDPIPSTPDEMTQFMNRESITWARVVKESGIRLD